MADITHTRRPLEIHVPNQADFGVGCFIFHAPTATSANEWWVHVRAALESIPSIENVETTFNPDEPDQIEIELLAPHPSNGGDLNVTRVTQPGAGRLSFTISIPQRVRSDMGNMAHSLTASRFQVNTQYEYYGPATFVRCLGDEDGGEEQPSGAVYAVRKLVEAELTNRSKNAVRLDVTGPSPFHADFHVHADHLEHDEVALATQYGRFEHIRVPQPGYDDIIFFIDTVDDPYSDLELALAPELSLFYHVHRETNSRVHRALVCLGNAQHLAQSRQNDGKLRRLRHVFDSGAKERNLHLHAISLEADSSMTLRGILSAVQEQEGHGLPMLFKQDIEKVATYESDALLRAARDITEALESFRKKSFEVAVLSSATLLGAAAGAIASVLVN